MFLGCGRSRKEKAVKKVFYSYYSMQRMVFHDCGHFPVLIGADVGYLKWRSDVYNEGVNQRHVGSECEIRPLNEG